MKNNKLGMLVGCACVVMSFSAFVLPTIAESRLVASGSVMEQEAPLEYMEDFIALVDPLEGLTVISPRSKWIKQKRW